jgi:hypothetical protein
VIVALGLDRSMFDPTFTERSYSHISFRPCGGRKAFGAKVAKTPRFDMLNVYESSWLWAV